MDLIGLLVGIVIFSVILWAIQQIAPEPFRRVLYVVVVVIFVLWLLQFLVGLPLVLPPLRR